jgi:hypothetical protein
MSISVIDLKAVDVILTAPDFGAWTIQGYGPNPVSVSIKPLDENLYTEAVGAFGDMLVNKSYKAKNMMLSLNILRKNYWYNQLKKVVALEKTGKSVIMAVLVRDTNGNEIAACAQAVMKTDPGMEWGSEPEANVEFKILMPSVVYTPPTLV